jgi:hypothetical protein
VTHVPFDPQMHPPGTPLFEMQSVPTDTGALATVLVPTSDTYEMAAMTPIYYKVKLNGVLGAAKEAGRWVTIDDHPVFIGGPGQGAGQTTGSDPGLSPVLDRIAESVAEDPALQYVNTFDEVTALVYSPGSSVKPQNVGIPYVIDHADNVIATNEYSWHDDIFTALDVTDDEFFETGGLRVRAGKDNTIFIDGIDLLTERGIDRLQDLMLDLKLPVDAKNRYWLADLGEEYRSIIGVSISSIWESRTYADLQRASPVGRKEDAHWVTIDDRPVLISGPAQGAGSTAQTEIDRAMALEMLCEAGGLTAAETLDVRGWLHNVPDGHLNGLSAIRLLREGEAPEGMVMEEDGTLTVIDQQMSIIGVYDPADSSITMAPSGFNRASLLHELGHHVTLRNEVALAHARVTMNWVRRDVLRWKDEGSAELEPFMKRLPQAGLRIYSLTSGAEFLADAYAAWYMGSPQTRDDLAQFWEAFSYGIEGRRPLQWILESGAVTQAYPGTIRSDWGTVLGSEKKARWVTIDDRAVLIGGPSQGAGRFTSVAAGELAEAGVSDGVHTVANNPERAKQFGELLSDQIEDWPQDPARVNVADRAAWSLRTGYPGVVTYIDGQIKSVAAINDQLGGDDVVLMYFASREPGHGRAMMAEIMRFAVERGKDLSWESLPDSQAFYNHIGFEPYFDPHDGYSYYVPHDALEEMLGDKAAVDFEPENGAFAFWRKDVGGKEGARWVTIDDRAVLIGGPGQGAGTGSESSGYEEVGQVWGAPIYRGKKVPEEVRDSKNALLLVMDRDIVSVARPMGVRHADVQSAIGMTPEDYDRAVRLEQFRDELMVFDYKLGIGTRRASDEEAFRILGQTAAKLIRAGYPESTGLSLYKQSTFRPVYNFQLIEWSEGRKSIKDAMKTLGEKGRFVTLGEGDDRRVIFIEGPGQGAGGTETVSAKPIAGLSAEQSAAVREAQRMVRDVYDGRGATLEVRAEERDRWVPGAFMGTYISINPQFFNDDAVTDDREKDIRSSSKFLEQYRADLAEGEKAGWDEEYLNELREKIERAERSLERELNRPVWTAAESMRDIVLHEYGHAIHSDVQFGDIPGISKFWGAPSQLQEIGIPWEESIPYQLGTFARRHGDTISEYAMTSDSEYFAEAFVRFMQGRADEIEFAPVRDVLEKVLNAN